MIWLVLLGLGWLLVMLVLVVLANVHDRHLRVFATRVAAPPSHVQLVPKEHAS